MAARLRSGLCLGALCSSHQPKAGWTNADLFAASSCVNLTLIGRTSHAHVESRMVNSSRDHEDWILKLVVTGAHQYGGDNILNPHVSSWQRKLAARRLWTSFATLGSALGLPITSPKTEAAESSPFRSETVEVPGANEFSPWNKPRNYRACTLANGLRVLLVSDMETSKIEAAFTAGFGQFDDPLETSGVAHLTEHLLLSSPGPNGAEPLETWLEEPSRDGDSNGFTAFDNALFTVSSNINEWQSALARFAHCFRRAIPMILASRLVLCSVKCSELMMN